ncbi:hypothetical protein NUW58_g3853 [Xylaria curta]|uniref:Uncharacterized protein n=1 Tax=Xylaria curta TaxID=42375 RepID=A0ACC1PAI8_9PEZI|nr:hypothetical protein NUW58_g3853 [Xylaria curta]
MFVLIEKAEQRQREYFKSNGRSEKRQTTIPESLTPRKVKRKLGKRAPAIDIIDLETVGDGATTSESATASTSNPAPPPPSRPEPSTMAETSTLKSSGKGSYSGLGNIYDTTSDEGEDRWGGSNRTANNTTLQPSAVAKTSFTQLVKLERKHEAREEENYDEFSTSGEEELIAVGDRCSKTASTLGKHREPFITPSKVRTTDIENGLPTPSHTGRRSVKKLLFENESNCSNNNNIANAKRQRLDPDKSLGTQLFGQDKTINLALSSSTSPELPASPASPRTNPANLTSEIMDLLKEEDIPFATRSAVRKALQKYENQAKGYQCDGDGSRQAIKELEDHCEQLQARIDSLENGREECRAGLRDLWDRI